MQEINQYKDLPNTIEEDEVFKRMEDIGLREVFVGMGSDLTGDKSNACTLAEMHAFGQTLANTTLLPNPPQPNPPQPSQVNPEAVIDEMLFNIKQSLLLLATVIKQNTTPPAEANGSLQETIELLLKQSDWFKEMVQGAVEDRVDEDMVREQVKGEVESEVDRYFSNSFDCTDHFDFNDAVSDAVSDQIQDAVSDKIDEAVDEYMSNATIKIER